MSSFEDLMQVIKFTEKEKEEMYDSPHKVDEWADEYIRKYDDLEYKFERETSLTSTDLSVMFMVAVFQCLRWFLVTNDSFRFDKAVDADKSLDHFKRSIKENLPTLESIAESVFVHTVPYDAIERTAEFKAMYPEDSIVSGRNHRYKTLGHDPVAGLVFGTINIATNTLTVADWYRMLPSYVVVNQRISDRTDLVTIMQCTLDVMRENPQVLGAAFIRQIIHMGTDCFTKQGIPIPLVSSVSPEFARFLVGNQIDFYSTTRVALLAISINKIAEMLHRSLFDYNKDSKELYEVRTKKILMYSNVLASTINISYVSVTNDMKRLDVGGILVALWRLINDSKKLKR